MSRTALPERATIDHQYTWNAESLFLDRDEWYAAFEEAEARIPDLVAYKGRLDEGPQTFTAFRQELEGLFIKMSKLRVYTSLASNVDTNDQQAASMNTQIQGLMAQLMGTVAFMDPELLAIGEDTLREWMTEDDDLAIMAHYVDNLFRKQEHVRDSEIEQLLGLVRDPFAGVYQVYSALVNADLDFADATDAEGEAVPVGQSNIRQIFYSSDRSLRRTGWNNYRDGYLGVKNTLTNNYITRVKQAVFTARARGHKSTLEAALHESNVPVEVFHNLIETYKANLPTWHRYWRIRREALGVEELYPYDTWAPISMADPDVTYEQAVDWISEGLAPLGESYVDAMRRGCLEERWVDVYPNKGKRLGAFSSGAKGTYPFIMLSFSGDLQGMSTLAHELGHSMHSYLTWQNQPFIYSSYSMFVAEVASNFNQAMTRAYLLAEKDGPEFQIAVIEEAMANFYRYFFVMPNLARFEYEVHGQIASGKGLTADDLNAIMLGFLEEGYGGEMGIDRERLGMEWGTFGHLYVPFYTFQYATGISGAHALSARILDGEEGATEDYLRFLSAGSSVYAVDALKIAGVDLSTPEPVEQTFEVMASLIDRLEELTASR